MLLLFDEVLNFMNRHRDGRAVSRLYPEICVATTGQPPGGGDQPAAQPGRDDRLGHAVAGQDHEGRRRVAKDLIANDEAEISEVVRRRLFEDMG